MADDSIVGAWELVSDSRVGVSIYTDSHFSTVMAAKNRQRSSGERATPDEALEALLTCPALSGTYAVSGSTGTYTRVANTRVERSDQPIVGDHTIVGDTMTFNIRSGASSTNAGASLAWRRIPSSASGNPLVGAWELVQDIWQGVAIFTGTHYAIVVMQKERNLPSGDQYTPEEALDAISTCGTFAGTYTVSGNTVTAKRIANLRPTLVGVDAVWESLVEGDTMKFRGISGGLPTDEWTWRRVS